MKLPALFQEIIEHDKKRPDRIISINDVKDWRKRRNELTLSAERYIKEARKGE